MSRSKQNVTQTSSSVASKAASAKQGKALDRTITEVPEGLLQMVAERAYFKAEHRGFQGGNAEEDWFEAEREINESLAKPRPLKTRSRTRHQGKRQRRPSQRKAS